MNSRNPDELPPELWMHVYSFLKPKELCNLELVSTKTQVLASDDAVWKAATGFTKAQLRNPSEILYSIFDIPRLEISASSVNSYSVSPETMGAALTRMKQNKHDNFISWKEHLNAENFEEPIILTTQHDDLMAYHKRFFDALLNTNTSASRTYFMLKFQIWGDDMIKIFSYQHCMAGFKNIMTYKPDLKFNLVDLKTPVMVSVDHMPTIKEEWRVKPSQTGLFASTIEKTGIKPEPRELKPAEPPLKKSRCNIS